MQMPNEASGPFAGLAAWFAGTYNYAVRVIQQDAKPGAGFPRLLRCTLYKRLLCG